jgi:hypothetical protein
VNFNGLNATSFALWSDSRIICKVPDGADSGNVNVTTGIGSSEGIAYIVANTGIKGTLLKGAGVSLDVMAGFVVYLGGETGATTCYSNPVDGSFAVPASAQTNAVFTISAPGYMDATAQGITPTSGTIRTEAGGWLMVPTGGFPLFFTI